MMARPCGVMAVTGQLTPSLSFDGRRYRWSGDPLGPATSRRVLAAVPGEMRPFLLRDLVDSGSLVLCRDVAAVPVMAWAQAGFPEDTVGCGRWREWFGAVGFAAEDGPAERPDKPVTLYRGCARDAVLRMAWTTRPAVAWWFAHGHLVGRMSGQVWAATVAPEYVLACLRACGEYVVDPAGLTDVRCTGW